MYLCNDGHAEICYEEKPCPCCELLKQIKGYDDESGLYDLKDGIM